MRLFAVSLLGALACGTAAVACPDVNMAQGATTYDSGLLGSVQAVGLTAGGDNRLDQCGLGAMGVGQFRSAPDHSFVVQGDIGQDVVLAVTSDCDAAMLVNTADGQWLFNDDGNGNLDPRLTIAGGAALDGQVDVWLGTFAGGECAATLNIAQAGVDMPIAQPGPGPMALATVPPVAIAPPVLPQPVAPQPMPAQTLPQPVPMPQPIPVPQPVPVPQPIPVPQPVPVPVPVPAPVPAAICPNPNMVGPSLNVSGPLLTSPQAYLAMVGVQHDVSACPQINGWGWADEAPSFTLFTSQMDGYTFTAETTSDCDPTMILRDAFGTWHFNDDGPNGLQPQIELDGSALNGRVDIWVGSFNGQACQGTITFRTVSAAPPVQPPVLGGACPNPGLMGPVINTTGSALYSPTDYPLTAGGAQEISGCGLPVGGFGYFSAAPNYSFFLNGMQDYGRLEIEGESACDTVMLVRTPDGMWHFDDDSNGNFNPLINLTNTFMLNGRVDVWVGTYSGGTCPASIELETWYN